MTAARRAVAVLPVDQARALCAALREQREFRLEQLADLDQAREGEITHQLRTAARFALAQIEAALDRMESGSYGACVHCGDQIAIERLEILPMVALCVRCQKERYGERKRSM